MAKLCTFRVHTDDPALPDVVVVIDTDLANSIAQAAAAAIVAAGGEPIPVNTLRITTPFTGTEVPLYPGSSSYFDDLAAQSPVPDLYAAHTEQPDGTTTVRIMRDSQQGAVLAQCSLPKDYGPRDAGTGSTGGGTGGQDARVALQRLVDALAARDVAEETVKQARANALWVLATPAPQPMPPVAPPADSTPSAG